MELLNGLISQISVDFDSNNNTPVAGMKQSERASDGGVNEDLNAVVIEMLNSFKEWKLSLEFIESQCPLKDYKNVKANGYRTMLKINTLAIKRVNKKLSQRELTLKHLNQSLSLSRLMIKINHKIKQFYDEDQEFKQNLINNNESDEKLKSIDRKPFISNNMFISQQSVEFFKFYDELEQDIADYLRYHPVFHYRKDLRKTIKKFMICCALCIKLPGSLLFNNKKRSRAMAEVFKNATMTFPFSLVDVVDCRFYKDVVIPLKYFNKGLSTKTVYLPRQFRFRLNDLATSLNTEEYFTIDNSWSYDLLKTSKMTKIDGIRVRIIKEKSSVKNKTVMFHVHGGAFVFHSPECHEVYLREFAKKLPEVVIISVAYRTRAEYPKAQQDVLDAYLWLISGMDEVEVVLGFKPEKIVLCGDSAGAFFNFTLLHLLIDFNKEIQRDNLLDQTLKYPDALFNFYGFYNLNTTSAAIFLSNLDLCLIPPHLRIAFGSLIWGVEKPKLFKRIFFPSFADKKKRWYNKSDLKESTCEMIKTFNSIPYLNSIHHFDFDAIKVPLYLVSAELDMCLDHNVDLANRWKGNVTILVLEDCLTHGFLQLEEGAKSIRGDILKSCNLLRTAFDKL